MSTPDISPHALLTMAPSKKDQRRLELIQAAIRSIARQGWEQTTLERIGREFKMQRSHVAYYFHGRDELLEACVRLVAATAQAMTEARVQAASPGLGSLRAIVDGAVDWLEQYPDQVSVFLLFYHLGTHREDYRKLQTDIRAVGAKRLGQVVGACVGKKMGAKEIEKTAKRIQNLITGFLVDFSVTEASTGYASLRKEMMDSVQSLLP